MTSDADIDVTAASEGGIATLHIEAEPFTLRGILDALDNTPYAHVAEAARAELGWQRSA